MRGLCKLVSVAALLLSFSPVARAADNARCFTAYSNWSVPRGGAAFNRSSSGGPVGAVIDAINEWWTHSAVSHGVGGDGLLWATMSTSVEPANNGSWPEMCDAPVHPGDLANGWPGSRTMPAGGLWTYYYGGSGGQVGQTDFRYKMPYQGTTDRTRSECMTDWYKNATPGCAGNCTNGRGYSVYGYMSTPYSAGSGGTMCSTNIAYMYYWGKTPAGAWCTPDGVNNKVYSNSQITVAANALYNSVKNQCSASTGFWDTVGFTVACLWDWSGPCDDAGDQVVNAFAYDQGTYATRSDHDWADNAVSGKSASTISPARMAGDYGNTGTDNNSPYRPYPWTTVTWSGAGASSGCWY